MNHRPARASDLDAIYHMYMEPAANPWLTYDPMDKEAFEPLFQTLLATGTLFVVDDGQEIIGTYRLIPKTDRQAHILYLGSFTIIRHWQGKGLGSRVLDHIKVYAFEQGKTRIELTVDVQNAPAIALYRKAGFLNEGRIRNSYRRNDTGEFYDEYLMAVLL